MPQVLPTTTPELEAFTVDLTDPSLRPLQVDQSVSNQSPPSQASIYQQVVRHAPDAIRTLVWLLHNSNNHNVRIGAANTLLAKVLPNLKQVENTGTVSSQMLLQLVTYGTSDPIIQKLQATEAQTVSLEDSTLTTQATPSQGQDSVPTSQNNGSTTQTEANSVPLQAGTVTVEEYSSTDAGV